MSAFDSDAFDTDVVAAAVSYGTSLADTLSGDFAAAVADYDQTFLWKGTSYACVINFRNQSLLVAKALFGSAGARIYPKRGDAITVGGRKVQVTALENSSLSATNGGLVEDKPFVDDPASPGLEIGFDKFIKR